MSGTKPQHMHTTERRGPFPVTCWIESREILWTDRVPSSRDSILCSAAAVLGKHHKSCSTQAQFLCAQAGNQDLNMIYRKSSTRVARPSHPHLHCHSDSDEEDMAWEPQQTPQWQLRTQQQPFPRKGQVEGKLHDPEARNRILDF